MKKQALCAALFASGALAPGCATVSMGGVAGDAARRIETASAAATPAQVELREASEAFTERAAEAGWADAGGDATRRAIDMLINGRPEGGAAEAAKPAPAEAFLAAHGYAGADPGAIVSSLTAEIREARARVRAVNVAAAHVVQGPEREPWSRRDDVRAAESVVQAARRTRKMLRDAAGLVAGRLDTEGQAAVEQELDALDLEVERLSLAANALSQERPGVQLDEVDVVGARSDGDTAAFAPDLG